MHLVEGKVPPEQLVSRDDHADQLLDLVEGLLTLNDLAHAQRFVVQLLAELVAFRYQVLFYPSQAQLLVEGEIVEL